MSRYLIDNYLGKYRIKCPYDVKINQFPRKLDDTYEDIDLYIDCRNGIQIFHYGHDILQAYIPSIGRGHNIINALPSNIIFDIEETSTEVLFKFKKKNDEMIISLLNPKTSGANISPFSTKNLPKNKAYVIPNEELSQYKKLISNLTQEEIFGLTHMAKNFLKTLCNKKYSYDDIKADMAKVGLRGKEYIHYIGKWNDYMKYVERGIYEIQTNSKI